MQRAQLTVAAVGRVAKRLLNINLTILEVSLCTVSSIR